MMPNKRPVSVNKSEAMREMIADMESECMDSQRASLHPNKKTSSLRGTLNPPQSQAKKPDDDFFDMLARAQGSRLEDQRSELPQRGVTVPEDDFFSLIVRVQGGRMEDQRATVPLHDTRNNQSKTSGNKK